MKEMFLLGAGASADFGIKVSKDITKEIYDLIKDDKRSQRSAMILKFIIGGLVFQKGSRGGDPYEGINIEELLNTVDMLSERNSSELNPFIAAWHPFLNNIDLGEISDKDFHEFLDQIQESVLSKNNSFPSQGFTDQFDFPSLSPFSNLRKDTKDKFQKIVRQAVASKTTRYYRATKELITRKLITLMWIDGFNINPDVIQMGYILDLVRYAFKNEIPIATLNYDTSIEYVCNQYGIQYDIGIESWNDTKKVVFSNSKLNLLKLHGSINWSKNIDPDDYSHPLPYERVSVEEKLTSEKRQKHDPEIILGGKNKLTVKGPFLGLLREFEEKLSVADRLIIVGYSFGDDHINQFINDWVNKSKYSEIIIIDPGISENNNDFFVDLKASLPHRLKFIEKSAKNGVHDYLKYQNQEDV